MDLNLEYVFVNVELEVGLNNPFVSEYPIARLATEYPNVEEIFGLVRFQWGSAIVSSISFEGGID